MKQKTFESWNRKTNVSLDQGIMNGHENIHKQESQLGILTGHSDPPHP